MATSGGSSSSENAQLKVPPEPIRLSSSSSVRNPMIASFDDTGSEGSSLVPPSPRMHRGASRQQLFLMVEPSLVDSKASLSQNTATSPRLSFTTFIVYVFMSGIALGILCLIAQMPLISTVQTSYNVTSPANLTSVNVTPIDNINPYADQYLSYWVVNLLIASWKIFSFFFVCSFAPSAKVIFWTVVLLLTSNTFLTIWSYLYFNQEPAVMILTILSGLTLAIFLLLGSSQRVYTLIASLPPDDFTIRLWLASIKYFAIAVVPLVAYVITHPSPTIAAASFCSTLAFAFALSVCCVNFRVQVAMQPSSSMSKILLGSLRPKQFLIAYGPPAGLLILFAVSYVAEISGFDSKTDFYAGMFILAVIFFVSNYVFSAVVLSHFSWFSPFTPEQQLRLETARVRGEAIRRHGIQIRDREGELRRQRQELINVLHGIESNLIELRQGVSLTSFVVYFFLIVNILSIPVLIAEMVMFGETLEGETSSVIYSSEIWIFNLIISTWNVFGLFFTISYAPSLRVMLMYFVSSIILASCLTVWAYTPLSIIGVVMFAITVLGSIFLLLIRSRIFKDLSELPVDNETLGFWFACFRYFIVVALPILANYASSQNQTQLSFLVVLLICATMSYLCQILRVAFAFKPFVNNTVGLMQQVSISQMLAILGPITSTIVVCIIVYTISLIGSTYELGTNDALPISFLSIGLFFILLISFLSIVFLSRLKALSFLVPFSKSDFKILALVKTKAAAVRRTADRTETGIKILKSHRSKAQKIVNGIDNELAELAGAKLLNTEQLMNVLIYVALSLSVSIMLVLFVQASLTSNDMSNTPALFVFDLIAIGAIFFTYVFVLLYSPSEAMIKIISTVSCFNAALLSICCFRNTDFVFAGILFLFATIALFAAMIFSKKIYDLISLLHFEDLTIEVYATSVRFYVIIVIRLIQLHFLSINPTPPVLTTPVPTVPVRPVSSSECSFIALGLYSITALLLLCNLRMTVAVNPYAKNVVSLFRQQVLGRLLQRLLPVFVLFTMAAYVFAVEIAGFGPDASNAFKASIIVLISLFGSWFAFNIVLIVMHSPKTQFLNPFSEEDYEALQAKSLFGDADNNPSDSVLDSPSQETPATLPDGFSQYLLHEHSNRLEPELDQRPQ